jgi:hypothetical protein
MQYVYNGASDPGLVNREMFEKQQQQLKERAQNYAEASNQKYEV